MELEITGIKRTSTEFIKQLFKKSIFNNCIEPETFDILKTFCDPIEEQQFNNKTTIILNEHSRKFGLGFARKQSTNNKIPIYGYLDWPNIFKNGETCKLECDLFKNMNFTFQKPLILEDYKLLLKSTFFNKNESDNGSNINFNGFGLMIKRFSSYKENFNCLNNSLIQKFQTSLKTYGICFDQISKNKRDAEKFTKKTNRIYFSASNDNMIIDVGVYSKKESINPFAKINLSGNLFSVNLLKNLVTFNSFLSTGFIITKKTHSINNIKLGSECLGCEANSIGFLKGGKSYIQIINKADIKLYNLNHDHIKIVLEHCSALVSQKLSVIELVKSFGLAHFTLPNVKNLVCNFGLGLKIPTLTGWPALKIMGIYRATSGDYRFELLNEF
ncbi:hypothetical protein EDEG_00469 [Edhazardia aedis USNM 41457]|uniref:Uncharacterized protein n=1 Tax=Edhazardia aedis (strain USNM 41457) TaxID=1003232 RepID=J9D187_EDHAE|nr:hypothetical protein EDEG_00469 [Edhazardia aedis USNM 41457]|eukprot:EJW01344.1 hypothetical protein EDEG_00469 [Edhazardia aedis USNM 41457]